MDDCVIKNESADGIIFRHFLLLLLAIAVIFPIFIGKDAFWNGEVYFAEAASELRERFLATGNWRELLKVTFNYQPGNIALLPGLLLQLPLSCLGMPSEFYLRISGVLALLVWLVLVWFSGKRLYPAMTCLWSVWMLAGSLGVIFWSRFASVDIWCAVFVTASIAWSLARIETPGFLTALVMTILAVIGAGLGGNLVYVFLPFVVLLPYNIHFDCGRKVAFWREAAGFLSGIALLLVLLAVVLFFNGLLKFHIWRNWPVELWDWLLDYLYRCWAKGDGWMTIVNIPRLLLPWSVFLLPLLVIYLRAKRFSDTDRMLLGGGLAGACLLITFTNGRWNVYLSLLPLFVLPLADAWRVGLEQNERLAEFLAVILRYSAIILAGFACCSFVSGFILNGFRVVQPMPLTALIIMPLTGVAAVIIMLWESFPRFDYQTISCLPVKTAAATIALSLLSCGLLTMFCPQLTIYRTEKDFFLNAKNTFSLGEQEIPVLCFCEKEVDGGFLFYSKLYERKFMESGTGVQGIERDNFDRFAAWINQHRGKKVIIMCRIQDVPELQKYAERLNLPFAFKVPEFENISNKTILACRQIERLVTDRNSSYRTAWMVTLP